MKATSAHLRWLFVGGLLALAALFWALSARTPAPPPSVPTASAPPQPAPRPAPRQAPPRAAVSGRVLSPEQRPLSGALVCAWTRGEQEPAAGPARPSLCAASDPQGAYSLGDLPPSTALSLGASAEGFVAAAPAGLDRGQLRLNPGEQRTGVDFLLRPGGAKIQGRVHDATGGVVAGAMVVISQRGAPLHAAQTNTQGDFSAWLEPGTARLSATAPGYAPTSASGPVPGRFFSLYLVPGSTLAGRAVERGSDTPVPAARVDAIQIEDGAASASVVADDQGKFRIEGLAPGRYRVEAAAEGRQGYSSSAVALALGETSREVIVEMIPARVVQGRAVDRATGQPCPAGKVLLHDRKQGESSQAPIDPSGRARLPSVLPGVYEVQVRCEGFLPLDALPPLVVDRLDPAPQTWQLDRGASVRVLVVDGRRAPVAAASVLALPEGKGSRGSADHPEPDGSFLIKGLAPGPHHIQAFARDGARGSAKVVADAGREERVTVEIPLTGSIEGVVLDEAQRPVADAPVQVWGPNRTAARSLDDGTFKVTGLPSGDYTLRVGDELIRMLGSVDERSIKVAVHAPASSRARLIARRRSGVIEGRVLDADGLPVTDAFVDVARVSPGEVRRPGVGLAGRPPAITDTAGRFRVGSLEEGEYSLCARRKGGGEATADHVKTGATDVTLKIAQAASLSGSLVSPEGPVDRFSLLATNTRTRLRRRELFFLTQGAFSLGDLPAGPYDLLAETPQGVASATVSLAEGEQKTDLRLLLQVRGVVRGRLVALEGGEPVAGMKVTLAGDTPGGVVGRAGQKNNVTGLDGRFFIDGALPGKWALTVLSQERSTEGFDGVSLPVEIRADQATDLGDLRLPRRRLAEGEAPGALGLRLSPAAGAGPSLEVAAASGAAEEAGIKPGDVITSVDGFDVQGASGYLFAPLTLVPAGRSLSIGLARGATVTLVARKE